MMLIRKMLGYFEPSPSVAVSEWFVEGLVHLVMPSRTEDWHIEICQC